jgi:hypothetical protein
MEWGDRGDELPWHGDLGQNPGCRFDFRSFHSTFHFPRDTPGTARNATGHYVVDVVEFPEWCSRLGKVCQG